MRQTHEEEQSLVFEEVQRVKTSGERSLRKDIFISGRIRAVSPKEVKGALVKHGKEQSETD